MKNKILLICLLVVSILIPFSSAKVYNGGFLNFLSGIFPRQLAAVDSSAAAFTSPKQDDVWLNGSSYTLSISGLTSGKNYKVYLMDSSNTLADLGYFSAQGTAFSTTLTVGSKRAAGSYRFKLTSSGEADIISQTFSIKSPSSSATPTCFTAEDDQNVQDIINKEKLFNSKYDFNSDGQVTSEDYTYLQSHMCSNDSSSDISIVSPKKDDIWLNGSSYTLSISGLVSGKNYEVYLLDNSDKPTDLGSFVAQGTTFSTNLTIGTKRAAGDYRFKLVQQDSVTSITSSVFKIKAPSDDNNIPSNNDSGQPSFTLPKEGDVWFNGRIYTLSISGLVDGQTYELYFLDNSGTKLVDLGNFKAKNKAYSVNVPVSDSRAAGTYKFKVVLGDQQVSSPAFQIKKMEDADSDLPPRISTDSTWQIGKSYEITVFNLKKNPAQGNSYLAYLVDESNKTYLLHGESLMVWAGPASEKFEMPSDIKPGKYKIKLVSGSSIEVVSNYYINVIAATTQSIGTAVNVVSEVNSGNDSPKPTISSVGSWRVGGSFSVFVKNLDKTKSYNVWLHRDATGDNTYLGTLNAGSQSLVGKLPSSVVPSAYNLILSESNDVNKNWWSEAFTIDSALAPAFILPREGAVWKTDYAYDIGIARLESVLYNVELINSATEEKVSTLCANLTKGDSTCNVRIWNRTPAGNYYLKLTSNGVEFARSGKITIEKQ